MERCRILALGTSVVATLALARAISAAEPVDSREQLNAILWFQDAPEYEANALATYRAATAQLALLHRAQSSASIEQNASGEAFRRKPRAIVIDIDETVLNNSPYNARLVADGTMYDEAGYKWADWVADKEAKAIPGAVDFIKEARRQGYAVLFVTNRNCNRDGNYDAAGESTDCPQEAATQANLKTVLGYTPADAELYLRYERKDRVQQDKIGKQQRRQEIAKTHRIVMLVGDDLNDFIMQAGYVPATHDVHWGKDWFVLTNPMYGSWDKGRSLAQRYASLDAWARAHVPAPAPRSPQSLHLVSWNLEWLADPVGLAAFWQPCAAQGFPANTKPAPDLPFCDVYEGDGITTPADYETKKLAPLRASLVSLAAGGMDLLAVQEVQSPAALSAVLPPDFSVVCFTTRIDAQNVGYAARTTLAPQLTCEEVHALSLETEGGRVRRGLALTVPFGATAAKLLNVHLKASCPKGAMDRPGANNCRTLQRQAAPLEQWIEAQANAGTPFAIIGDWNRDLEQEIRGGFPARSDGSNPAGPIDPIKVKNLFPELNDGAPLASAMRLAAIDRSAATGNACHDVLDQMVVSDALLAALDPASLESQTLPAAFALGQRGASDHCAVRVTLAFAH